MPYSLDLRKKVINYVERGGGVTKASQIFQVSRASIYRWLNRENLEATKVKRRQRKLNWEALKQDVRENPQQRLIDRAIKFEVQPSAILYALRQMKITRKKKQLRYRERNRQERIKYYRRLRELIRVYGSKSLVFIDESGFEPIRALYLCLVSKRTKDLWRLTW